MFMKPVFCPFRRVPATVLGDYSGTRRVTAAKILHPSRREIQKPSDAASDPSGVMPDDGNIVLLSDDEARRFVEEQLPAESLVGRRRRPTR